MKTRGNGSVFFTMEFVSNSIITLGALALLLVGIYLAITDKTSSAAAALGFSFLFVVLLLLAKFKRFKGFGFEAEMWEQKQEELVNDLDKRLKNISNVKEKITEKLKSDGPPGRITPEILRDLLIDITDAL